MSSKYEILYRKGQEMLFREKLQEIDKSLNLHSQYTADSIAYFQQRYIDDGMIVEDMSIILSHEGKAFWGFLGFKYGNNNRYKVGLCEIPATFLEFRSLTKKEREAIGYQIEAIRDVALNAETTHIIDTMAEGKVSYSSHYLISKYKSTQSLVFKQMIDLKAQESHIKSNIRRSYKSCISWGLREIEITLMSAKNANWEDFEKFKHLHHLCAGRKTRSDSTWERQFESIKNGSSFCILGKQGDELLTAGLFSYSYSHCSYASSASRRDMFDKPLFHCVMWKAILHAKILNLKYFEVGEQYSYDSYSSMTEKEKNIAKFKAGFGGDSFPQISYSLN